MNTHCLLFPNIAHKVFNYLSFPELCQIKRVCKKWNSLISSYKFEDAENLIYPAKPLSKKQAVTFKKFCKYVEILEKIELEFFKKYVNNFTFHELISLGNNLNCKVFKNITKLNRLIRVNFLKKNLKYKKRNEIKKENLVLAEKIVHSLLEIHTSIFPPPKTRIITDDDLNKLSIHELYKKLRSKHIFKRLSEDEILENKKKILQHFVKNLAPQLTNEEWEEIDNFKQLNLFIKLKNLNHQVTDLVLNYQENHLALELTKN